ncbi:DUF2524 family protein [Bacillus alkalicellulosilyticus]|uniref:DUF2524 family protein n=1 Tax=Alkalihalobacterium alkalicellulosilyticum TaxID=1912214 RepID=UPI0009984D80|nr:DUF2524 family protein [Bacillus alkalicellulosilyticus]
MATHDQINYYVEKVSETIDYAQKQLDDFQRVEHGNSEEYTNAQLQLEEINQELDSIIRSATPEQREQLNRAQQRLRQMQNHMILRQ